MVKVRRPWKTNSYLEYAFNKFLLNVDSLFGTTTSGLVSSQGSSGRSLKQPRSAKCAPRLQPQSDLQRQQPRCRQGAQGLRSTAILGAEPTVGRALRQLPASGGAPGCRAQPSWRPRRRTPWAISRLTAAAAQVPQARRITASRRKRIAGPQILRSRRAAVGTRQRSGCQDPTNCFGAWLARPFSTIRSTNR